MDFSRICAPFLLLTALLTYVSDLALANDIECFLANFDVVNLTSDHQIFKMHFRASFWEVEWNDPSGCLENALTCKFYFSLCKPVPVTMAGDGPRCVKSSVCLQYPARASLANTTFLNIGAYFPDPFKAAAATQFWASYPTGQTHKKPDGTACTTSTVLHFMCNEAYPWIAGTNPAKGTKVPHIAQIVYNPQTCSHIISMPYAGACPTNTNSFPGGMSAGSVLLIMFFCALSVYLIGGVAYNYSQGARSKEMLPHLEFWLDLPTNIMAGFTLTRLVLTCQEIPKRSPTYQQL